MEAESSQRESEQVEAAVGLEGLLCTARSIRSLQVRVRKAEQHALHRNAKNFAHPPL